MFDRLIGVFGRGVRSRIVFSEHEMSMKRETAIFDKFEIIYLGSNASKFRMEGLLFFCKILGNLIRHSVSKLGGAGQ